MQSPGLDELHGIAASGAQLGHGNAKHISVPAAVQYIAVPDADRPFDPMTPSAWPLLAQSDGVAVQWRTEAVACGLDHMAAMVTLCEEEVSS